MNSAKDINNYYDQSLEDYKLIWNTGKNYALHAGFYDSKHKRHDDAILNMNRFIAKLAKIAPADHVLDAGCGIGGTSIWIAKNIGAKICGININHNQLEIARKIAIKEGVTKKIEFKLANFHKTGLKSKCFDSVIAIESVCHSDDKAKFIDESYRLLKSSGRLVVADGFIASDKLSKIQNADLRRWLDGWSVHSLASVENFSKMLKKSGFKNIKYTDVTSNVMKSSDRLYLASILNYPIAKIMEFFKIRSKVQTGNVLGAFYQHKTLKQGLWKYCVFIAEK